MEEDPPAWKTAYGIGTPWQPTKRGRQGCLLFLYTGLAVIVLIFLVAGVIALL